MSRIRGILSRIALRHVMLRAGDPTERRTGRESESEGASKSRGERTHIKGKRTRNCIGEFINFFCYFLFISITLFHLSTLDLELSLDRRRSAQKRDDCHHVIRPLMFSGFNITQERTRANSEFAISRNRRDILLPRYRDV